MTGSIAGSIDASITVSLAKSTGSISWSNDSNLFDSGDFENEVDEEFEHEDTVSCSWCSKAKAVFFGTPLALFCPIEIKLA